MCITGDFLWSMEFGVDSRRRLVVSYFLCEMTGILPLLVARTMCGVLGR